MDYGYEPICILFNLLKCMQISSSLDDVLAEKLVRKLEGDVGDIYTWHAKIS